MAPPNSQSPNATKVDYAGQTEAELRDEYQRKVEENPGFVNLVPNVLAYVQYKSEAAAYQAKQEKDLEQVVENYRPPMSTAGSHYLGYPHEQLKSMVTDNMSPSSANEQGEAWTKIGNTLVDLQNNLTKATEAGKGAWQGKAASAAQGYFTNMAAWSGNAAQGAQLTGNKLYQQSQAAETAKANMPEPVDFSTADAYKMFFSEPNPFKWAETIDKIEQKFEEKQQAHERAAEVMTSMSTSFQESGSTMPAFSPPPPMEGTGGGTGDSSNPQQPGVGGRPSVPDGPGGGTGGTGVAGVPGPGGGGPGGGGSGGGNTNQSGWKPPTGLPLPGPGTGGGPGTGPGDGSGNGWVPGPGGRPPGPGGRPPGLPGGRPPGLPGPGGRPPGLPGGGRGLPGGGGGLPGGGGGPGGRGGLPGGMGGPGGMAAAGRGGGFGPGGASGVLGEAGRSGAGGFGPAGPSAAGGGLAGRGGAGGTGMGAGGMGAGAGKGQGDEDKEHKAASYLVETEDVFGDGTMVAPPVIGG